MKTTIVLAKTEMTGLRETGRFHRPDGVNCNLSLKRASVQ